jgi:hypothetical protein
MSTRKNQESRAVADARLTVLVDSSAGALAVARALPNSEQVTHIRVLDRCGRAAASAENLLVFSAASKLDRVAKCVSIANKAHRLAALLVYNDVAANWLPYVFHRSGLRALRNMLVHSDPELPTRILSAWAMGAERDFIADAAVINSHLVVRSCAFEDYSVSFDAFPALRAIPESAQSNFVLEDEGLLLYWPDFHVHLDLEDIRFANDPKRQQAARTASLGDQRAIGAALKRLREEAGVRKTDIKGISERQVRRVEAGDRLTVDTLDAFAIAMGVDSDYLLERLGEVVADSESTDLQPPAFAALPPESKQTRVAQGDAQILAYPPSSPVRSTPFRNVSENLQLAAHSSEDHADPHWDLSSAENGSIHGLLEHDYRADALVFVVEDVHNVRPNSLLSIVLTSSRVSEPLVSVPFVPSVGARVPVASGRGIVPRDVSNLELRVVNG